MPLSESTRHTPLNGEVPHEVTYSFAIWFKGAHKASSVILINDLLRTQVGYWLAWTGCRSTARRAISLIPLDC